MRSLWLKFFLLLFTVAAVALIAAFALRQLMIRDFREYSEGQREDRVYWLIADLESAFERDHQWNREHIDRTTLWAAMMGFEMRVRDMQDHVVADTRSSLASVPQLIQKRVLAFSSPGAIAQPGPFSSYPLFLAGKQIGSADVRFLHTERDDVFIRRSDKFLLFTVIVLGAAALLLSVLFARRLTRPLKSLALAAEGIIEGNLQTRVAVSGKDEVARLSATFNRVIKFLENQEGLRKKLISNVAHEIRTPLTALRGELAGMIDGLIPADRPQLQSLYDETFRLEGFLDDIEELSRAQAGTIFFKRRDVALVPLLEKVTAKFRGIALDKGVSLEINGSPELTVYADPERMFQILVNLVSNALKATDRGGTVALRAAKSGHETRIEVEDSGCGISQDDLPFIFERFFRSSEGGIGIGLTIVREIVSAHEGRIEVRSTEGKGTAFTLFIPDLDASRQMSATA